MLRHQILICSHRTALTLTKFLSLSHCTQDVKWWEEGSWWAIWVSNLFLVWGGPGILTESPTKAAHIGRGSIPASWKMETYCPHTNSYGGCRITTWKWRLKQVLTTVLRWYSLSQKSGLWSMWKKYWLLETYLRNTYWEKTYYFKGLWFYCSPSIVVLGLSWR